MNDVSLNYLVTELARYRGGPVDAAQREAASRFVRHADADPGVLAASCRFLLQLPPHGAALLAVLLGAAVEDGADPKATGPAVIDTFLSWLPELAQSDEGGEHDEIEQPFLDAFPQLCQSVVAHLARMPERHAAMAADTPLMECLQALADISEGALWVYDLLGRRSGQMVVLHVPSARGFKVMYRGIGNCFHLFSLLQIAIGTDLPGGREPNPALIEASLGNAPDSVDDEAWWHYGNALCPTADIAASIWGEASVDSIPSIDGVQVLLLWPPVLASRGWESDFFGVRLDAMPAEVNIVELLDTVDCLHWFKRLNIDRSAGAAVPQ